MMTKATIAILERIPEGQFVATKVTGTTKATLMRYVNNGWLFHRERRRLTEASATRPPSLWARSAFGTVEMERAKRKLLTS